MVFKFFNDKSSSANSLGGVIKNEIMLISLFHLLIIAEDLQKLIIRKIEKLKLYLSLKDNIWSADIADMLLISTFNKEFRFYYELILLVVNMHGLFL